MAELSGGERLALKKAGVSRAGVALFAVMLREHMDTYQKQCDARLELRVQERTFDLDERNHDLSRELEDAMEANRTEDYDDGYVDGLKSGADVRDNDWENYMEECTAAAHLFDDHDGGMLLCRKGMCSIWHDYLSGVAVP